MRNLPEDWQQAVVQIAVEAGDKILAVYQGAFDVERKDDGSPLTQADHDSHHHIVDALAKLTPEIPVISEESYKAETKPCEADLYWLVDPLDGTKEFIKRNGEFTVNIALIENNRPAWGVVQAPVMDLIYFGGPEYGAIKQTASEQIKIEARQQSSSNCTLVVSRSHLSEKTKALFTALEESDHTLYTVASGSSLKFCMIADGQADCYPRLGLTSEWDTAAAEAVLKGAGGDVIRLSDGLNLDYNKADILNPEFIACGKLAKKTKVIMLDWYKTA